MIKTLVNFKKRKQMLFQIQKNNYMDFSSVNMTKTEVQLERLPIKINLYKSVAFQRKLHGQKFSRLTKISVPNSNVFFYPGFVLRNTSHQNDITL